MNQTCLLYTSDAADDRISVDLGGRRIIKKIFFKQKTAYEIRLSLVGSEMCIRDRSTADSYSQPQNTGNGYGQFRNDNNAGGYGQPQNNANNYGQGQNNYAYGQPYANYNQGPFQGPSLTPMEMEEPVGTGEWVGLLVLSTFVPCIGIILMLVWAFGNTEKKSKANFCKAFLIVWLIKLALYAILFIIWGASVAALINEF